MCVSHGGGNCYCFIRPASWASSLALEELQTVLVIQVSAPELVVVLFVRVAPVYGGRTIDDQLLGGADDRAVAGAKERRHRHPIRVRVHDSPMTNAPVSSIAQCLQ